jgi:uncharacterized membrane protein
VVGFVLIAPIVALIRSSGASRKAEAQQQVNESLNKQLRHLTERIYKLEKTIEKIGEVATRDRPATDAEIVKNAVESVSPSKALRDLTQPPSPTPTELKPPVPTPVPPPKAVPETSRVPIAESIPYVPRFARQTEEKSGETRSWADIEERVGASWLNKIGTAAFVIGVALLLNYSMHYLGPRGKIGLGYFLAGILLSAGVVGERKERYKIAGRAVLGGGWALAYFTTYAIHNVAAVRLVESPELGFSLLFTVGVAMVAHSLRYHSEVTTGFAYLLAFGSLAVSEIPTGALFASALLAASLVIVLRVRHWFIVEPFAIGVTYLVHWMWLNQIYERLGVHKLFPQFPTSVALLSFYWVIYLASYFLREERNTRESRLLTASFLLNAAGYLSVLHYQSFHPEWRFWFLLISGAVYLGVSWLSRRLNRRLGFILASTLGAALMIAAVPYRYSGGRLETLWLVETEALLIVGWRLLDSHLRKLAWAGAAILAGYVAVHDVWPRFLKWQPPDTKMGWIFWPWRRPSM